MSGGFEKNSQQMRMAREFAQFLKASEVNPPAHSLDPLLAHVRSDLNPATGKVMAQLAAIHVVVGGLTLIFCPQLGVGPLGGGHGLMSLFMSFGPIGCAWACGLLFLGASHAVAALLLGRAELRKAIAMGWVPVSCLAALSLAVLIIAGGSASLAVYLNWWLASLVGGVAALRGLGRFRLARLA